MGEQQEVMAGQLWVDNDPRTRGTRFIYVTVVVGDKAVCRSWYDKPGSLARSVDIKVSRFRASSTGYRPATAAERKASGVAS